MPEPAIDGHAVTVDLNAAAAVRNAHTWFETNSGWAPPDPDTLAEWLADGVCRCPDDCLVSPAGWCAHGLASWLLILDATDDDRGAGGSALGLAVPSPRRLDPRRPDYARIMRAHQQAVERGDAGYLDPTTGLFVMTAQYLWERAYCCEQGCRHCPYL
jgi:Family of unknown function (DUF5522)